MYTPFHVRGAPSFVNDLVHSLFAGLIAHEPQVLFVTAFAVVGLLVIVRNKYRDGRRCVTEIIVIWVTVGLCLSPWLGIYLWPDLALWIGYPVVPDYPWIYPTAVAAATALLAPFPKIVHSAR
jgi:hypothetical protein